MTITVKMPVDSEERNQIFRFLYEIWADELETDISGMNHNARVLQDEFDPWARHFIAVDETGKIIGCMRNNHFSDGVPSPEMDGCLRISQLCDIFGREKVAYTSHLALEPSARGRTVTSQIFFSGFYDALRSGIHVAVCYAALHLVQLYYQIGYRPYAPTFQTPAGIRVPLILCVHDLDYFERVKSPLRRLLPRSLDDRGVAALRLSRHFSQFQDPGFSRHTAKSLWAQLAHVTCEAENQNERPLFDGFTEDELNRIMAKATCLEFGADKIVIQKDEPASVMGVLLSGKLGIGVLSQSKPLFVHIIHPGEPFGELSGYGFGRWSLDIVALEHSKVMLLPTNFVERFCSQEPSIGIRLTQNLLRILAYRVRVGHQTIARFIDRNEHEVRTRRQSILPPPPPMTEMEEEEESYEFKTLCDPDSEYDRLSLQATIAEGIEFSKLAQIGMKSGDVIVDVGSGPGIVSSLLSKYFPESRIIGIEPDSGLISRAIATSKQHGYRRCTFLPGRADQIPLANDSVDFCYARLLFQHIPRTKLALKEMQRITKTGGLIAVLDVDDASIVTHPEIPDWTDVQKKVAKVQAENGGNRFVGRELFGKMIMAGMSGVHVEVVPLTTVDLGGASFYEIVFGFKRQILKRAGMWDVETEKVFNHAKTLFKSPTAFGMVSVILAHGRVPASA